MERSAANGSPALSGRLRAAGGPGAGHFVKLVHDGIEFGMLQAVGEGMDLLEQTWRLPTFYTRCFLITQMCGQSKIALAGRLGAALWAPVPPTELQAGDEPMAQNILLD